MSMSKLLYCANKSGVLGPGGGRMKFSFRLNPVAFFFIVLCLIIASSVTAFYLSVNGAYELGAPPLRLVIRDVYRSEPWTFRIADFSISLPGESYVSPVYLDERLIGIVVQSAGGSLKEDGAPRRLNLDDFFITMNSEIFTDIKGDTLFLPLQESAPQSRIMADARPLIRLPELQGIIYPRIFLPHSGAVWLYAGEGVRILLSGYNTEFFNPRLFLFFSIVALITLLIIYLLTMDLHPTGRLKRLHAVKPPLTEKLAAGIFLIVLCGAAIWGMLPTFEAASINAEVIVLYYAILFILLRLRQKQTIANQYFGLNLNIREYLRGMIVVPVILVILFLFVTLKFPAGINVAPEMPQSVLLQFAFLFAYAFAAEFFWRGYLQTFLERLWGEGAGLILATAFSALPFFLSSYFVHGLPLPPETTLEVFFFYPLTVLPLAYLYQRSRNLLSVSLLHAMLLFLPGFLIF